MQYAVPTGPADCPLSRSLPASVACGLWEVCPRWGSKAAPRKMCWSSLFPLLLCHWGLVGARLPGWLAWVLEHKAFTSPCLLSLPRLWPLIILCWRVSGRGHTKASPNYQDLTATHCLGRVFSNGGALFGERQFVGSSGQCNLWAPSRPVRSEVAVA